MIIDATERLLAAWDVPITRMTVLNTEKGKRTGGTVYTQCHMSTTDLIMFLEMPRWHCLVAAGADSPSL